MSDNNVIKDIISKYPFIDYIDPEFESFNNTIYFIRYPWRILSLPISWVLGKIIVQAQDSEENLPVAPLGKIISKKGFEATYGIINDSGYFGKYRKAWLIGNKRKMHKRN